MALSSDEPQINGILDILKENECYHHDGLIGLMENAGFLQYRIRENVLCNHFLYQLEENPHKRAILKKKGYFYKKLARIISHIVDYTDDCFEAGIHLQLHTPSLVSLF